MRHARSVGPREYALNELSKTAALFAALLSGCAPDDLPRWFPLPDLGAARAVVLALESADRVLEIEAWSANDVADRSFRSAPEPRASSRVVEALAFDRTLSDLGLPDGALTAATSGSPGRPIAALADRVYQLSLPRLDRAASWVPVDQPSQALAAFEVPAPPKRCATFSIMKGMIDTPHEAAYAIDVGAGRVMIGTRLSEWLVDSATMIATPIIRGGALARTHAIMWAIQTEDHALWLTDDGLGGLFRAPRFANPLVAARVATASTSTMQLAGSSSVGTELYILTASQTLHRFDGHRMHKVGELPPETTSQAFGDRLLRTSDGRVFVSTHTMIGIDRLEPATGSFALETVSAAGGIFTMVELPLGILAGTSQGEILLRGPGGWAPLATSPVSADITVIARFGDGFVYGGNLATFGQYTAEDGFCAPMTLGFAIYALAVIGDGPTLLATGDNKDFAHLPFAIVRADR
jgi:hypothetical protein